MPPTEEVFNEIKAIAGLSFRFAERGSTITYANTLATWMQSPVPREKILTAKYLLEDFNYDQLAASLQLLDPRRATVAVICRELPKNVNMTFDKKEPIYGTEYCERMLSPEFMKEVRHRAMSNTDGLGHQWNSHSRGVSTWT
jgi:insulysin